MFKKVVLFCLLTALFFIIFTNSTFVQVSFKVNALEVDDELSYVTNNQINEISSNEDVYVIYSIDGNYLFEKQNVLVGDEYIDKEMRIYVIIEIDEKTKTGKAKFVEKFDLPKVKKREDVPVSAVANARGKVGIYMTHNDESYVSGDGYDSVYGKGGIHDVATAFSLSLNSKRISTVFSDNLHIPHDSYAYSRSNVTAKSLINNYGSEAIFDIHRDGTSRGFYITKVNGEERCMVRMVVGKSSANYSKNKAFALFLMSVAKEYVPWLFVDIYLGAGHYNQGLSEYAMLFEMGSHLVEKDLVLKTVPYLAEVVSIALYGELEIVPDNNENNNANLEGSQNGDQNDNNNAGNNQEENEDEINNENSTNNNQNKETNEDLDNKNQSNGIINGGNDVQIEDFEHDRNGELTSNNSNNLLNDEQNNFNSSNGQGFLALIIVVGLMLAIYCIHYIIKRKNHKK